MKKRIVVAGALLAIAGSASAQSSLTIFGAIDTALTRGSATGAGSSSLTSVTTSGNNTSKLGFRGSEDLGGGMTASFWLESQLYTDTGAAGREGLAQNQTITVTRGSGLNFTRRSTVSLAGPWGEVRLGRDFTPTLYGIAIDPFLNNGVGTSLVPIGSATGLNAGAAYSLVPAGQGTSGPVTRVSNEISYFLPKNSTGIYGQVSYWLGENPKNGAPNQDDGTGAGVRVGYTAGPVDVSAAWSKTKYRATPVATTTGAPSGDFSVWNVGGQWTLSAVRLMATYDRDKRGGAAPVDARSWLVGGVMPIGPHEIKASFSEYRINAGTGIEPRSRLVALGYVYNVSKRTSVYATAARVSNSNGARFALGGATIGAGLTSSSSTGLDLGVQHSF